MGVSALVASITNHFRNLAVAVVASTRRCSSWCVFSSVHIWYVQMGDAGYRGDLAVHRHSYIPLRAPLQAQRELGASCMETKADTFEYFLIYFSLFMKGLQHVTIV